MSLFTVDLKPESLGETLNGVVRPKHLNAFLKSIPDSRIQSVGLYVDHSGVILKSEDTTLEFFNESILVGNVGFTPHQSVSSVLEIFMDDQSIEVKFESHPGGITGTVATLMIVLKNDK